jgi:hypothetical protein
MAYDDPFGIQLKDRNTMAKQNRTKRQTVVDKILHRKLDIEQHEIPLKTRGEQNKTVKYQIF